MNKKLKLFGRFFVFTLIILGSLMFSRQASAATYYVDSSITDTNVANATPDCTTYNPTTFSCTGGTSSAFKTIADINAFSALAPGDFVLFRKGQTWREQLTVPSSGSDGNPITFGAYGEGELPIITAFNTTTWNNYKESSADSYLTFNGGIIPDGWVLVGSPVYFDFTDETMGIDGYDVKFTGGSARKVSNTDLYNNETNLYMGLVYRIGSDLTGLNDFIMTMNDADIQRLVEITDNGDNTWSLLVGDDNGLNDTGIDLLENTNYQFDVYYKSDATTGGTKLWYKVYDGTPIDTSNPATVDYQNHNTSTDPVDDIYFGHNGVTSGSSYMDNIEVSNTGFGTQTSIPNIYTAGVGSAFYVDTTSLGTQKSNIADLNTEGDWYLNSGQLLVYSSSTPPTLEYSARDMSVRNAGKSYITFSNLHLIGNGENLNYGSVLNLGTGSDYNEITGCTIEKAITGVGNGGSGVMIGSSDNVTIEYSTIKDNSNDGVWIGQSDNFIIRNSEMSGNGLGTGIGDQNNIGIWDSPNTKIYNNILNYTGGNDNLELTTDNGTTIGLQLYNNIINNSGADVGSNGVGIGNGVTAEISYNIITGNNSQYGLFIPSINTLDSISVFNNTFSGWDRTFRIYDEGTVNANSYFSFKNNISSNITTRHIEVNNATAIGATVIIDNNLYDDDTGTKFKWGNTTYNFANWKTNSGQDAHSTIGNPLFIGSGNYSLQSGSPAIDTGENLGDTYKLGLNPNSVWPSSVNTLDQTLNGAGWEMGAYVFPVTKTTPTLSVTNSPLTYNTSPQAATVSGSVAGTVSNIQYNGSGTTPTNAGTYAITADFAPTDSANYNSLTGASAGNFIISSANQSTLTFTGQTVTSPATFTALSTTGGTGTGAVSYSVTTAGTASCSIVGTTLSYTSVGTCGVTATKAADSNYNSVSSSEATFTINAIATHTITASAGVNGSISPSGSVLVNDGATSSFTLTPSSGYSINIVTGSCGGTLVSSTYTTNAITADCTVSATFIDNTGPTGTISNGSGSQTNSVTPTLNLTIADTGVGITGAQMQFSCNGTNWSAWESYAASKTNFNVRTGAGCTDADGSKTVYVQYKDSLDNVGTSYNTGAFTLNTSTSFATLSGTPAGITNSTSASITVAGTDITAYEYKLDSGSYSTETLIDTPISLSSLADGSHILSVIGKNSVGTWQDQGVATTYAWIVDTIAPVVTFSIPATSNSLTITLTSFSVTDANTITGYLVNETAATPAIDDTGWAGTTQTQYVFTTEGAKTLYAWAKDGVGNISTGGSGEVTITLTTQAPSTINHTSSGSSASSRYTNLISMGNTQAAQELAQQFPNQISNNQIPLVPSTPTTPTVTPTTSLTPSTPLTLLRILKLVTPRMWGDDIKALQTFLNTKGYDVGTPDGNFGPKTQVAVIAFQKANGLVSDGSVGPNTLKYLNGNQTTTTTTSPVTIQPTVTRILKLLVPRMIGDDVKTLQTYLSTNGYDIGTPDGVFGSKTYSAVIAFQTANGLKPDGIVGLKTREMMK